MNSPYFEVVKNKDIEGKLVIYSEFLLKSFKFLILINSSLLI